MNIIKMFVVGGLFIGHVVLCMQEDNAVPAWLVSYVRKNEVEQASPLIKEEVKRAFDACNITEPIIVLQSGKVDMTYVSSLGSIQDFCKILVVGVQDNVPLSLIKYNIYHECGHIKHNDGQLSKKLGAAALVSGISYGVSKGLYNMAKDKVPNAIRLSGAVVAGAAVMGLYRVLCRPYLSRIREQRANTFATQKFIEQKDFEPIIATFMMLTNSLDAGQNYYENEVPPFNDHPSFAEQAVDILNELEKAGVDLNAIPLPEKTELWDRHQLQTQFTTQRKKYFVEV